MKKIFFYLVFSLCALTNNVYAQNGTYKCNSQGYSKADKSENKSYSNKLIITIDISDILGGYIAINNMSQDLNFRYDIISKDQTVADKNARTITNTFKAKMSQFNQTIGDEVLIGIVQNMDNNNLDFWVYTSKFNAYNQYFNLLKFE